MTSKPINLNKTRPPERARFDAAATHGDAAAPGPASPVEVQPLLG